MGHSAYPHPSDGRFTGCPAIRRGLRFQQRLAFDPDISRAMERDAMSTYTRRCATLAAAAAFACAAATTVAQTLWTVRGGTTDVSFHRDALTRLGLAAREPAVNAESAAATQFTLPISAASNLVAITSNGVVTKFPAGSLLHLDGLMLQAGDAQVRWDSLVIEPSADENGPLVIHGVSGRGGLTLGKIRASVDPAEHRLLLESADVAVSRELADALHQPELAGEVVASLTLTATVAWGGGADPAATPAAEPAAAGGTACLRPGGADVIVGALADIRNYASSNGIEAYAVGTTSCNVGTEDLEWYAHTDRHPVIGQGMYRLKNGRFEQIGLSWLKHGFNALTMDLCECGCNGHGGTVLGVGCSDPYEAELNGDQNRLGPRFSVNPYTGEFNYPYYAQGVTGSSIYKRLQVHISDLDPAQNGGGQYFVEGQYVTPDDAAAGNQANNASFRPISITRSGNEWNAALVGITAREQPAIRAWETWDSDVETVEMPVPGDGLVLVAGKATFRGGNRWHYEYAVQNLYCDRAVGAFSVPVGIGAAVSSIGFHDVDYHSGEPYDGTDWSGTYDGQYVTWATTPYATNPDANALRWGTIYNYRFDADQPPGQGEIALGLFKPGTPDAVSATLVAPEAALLCATAFGDADGDCDADLFDYALLQWCFTGMASPYAPNCACFDVDTDLDIDLADVAHLAWTGPEGALPGCALP